LVGRAGWWPRALWWGELAHGERNGQVHAVGRARAAAGGGRIGGGEAARGWWPGRAAPGRPRRSRVCKWPWLLTRAKGRHATSFSVCAVCGRGERETTGGRALAGWLEPPPDAGKAAARATPHHTGGSAPEILLSLSVVARSHRVPADAVDGRTPPRGTQDSVAPSGASFSRAR
jgi:hypothetical protein